MCFSILTSGFCFAQEGTVEFENGEKMDLAIEWNRPDTELSRFVAGSFGLAFAPTKEDRLSLSPQLEYEKRVGKFLISSKNYFFYYFDPRFELGSFYRLGGIKTTSRQKVFLKGDNDYLRRVKTRYYVKTRVPAKLHLDFYSGYSFMSTNVTKPISYQSLQEAFNDNHSYNSLEKDPVLFTHSLDFGLALVRNTHMKFQVNDATQYRFSQIRISLLGHYAFAQNLRLEYSYNEMDPNVPGRQGALRTGRSNDSQVLDDYKIPLGFGIRFEKRVCQGEENDQLVVGNYEISLSYFPLIDGEAILLRYATGLGGVRLKTK